MNIWNDRTAKFWCKTCEVFACGCQSSFRNIDCAVTSRIMQEVAVRCVSGVLKSCHMTLLPGLCSCISGKLGLWMADPHSTLQEVRGTNEIATTCFKHCSHYFIKTVTIILQITLYIPSKTSCFGNKDSYNCIYYDFLTSAVARLNRNFRSSMHKNCKSFKFL